MQQTSFPNQLKLGILPISPESMTIQKQVIDSKPASVESDESSSKLMLLFRIAMEWMEQD